MHRPIGITILALLAGLAGVFEIWRALVFLGVVSFEFIGKPVAFDEAQWGPAFWAVVLALIWFWVAAGLWNVRAYAWQFGNFIAIFTVIFGFFAIIGSNSTTEAETVGWFLALAVLFYLNYPGVRDQFIQHEMDLMTPEQRAAFDQMQAAQVAMAQASATAAAAPPPASTPPPPPTTPAPPAPPAGGGGASAS